MTPRDYKAEIDASAAQTAGHAGDAGAFREAASVAANTATNAASTATTKAAEASDSADAADADRVSAQAANASAWSALDQFTDLYLGAKTADPATDNDGDALDAGALYFNTTAKEMRAYNDADSTWYSVTDAAAAASDAATSETNAGNSATAASQSATAAAASESSAAGSDTAANASAVSANTFSTNAVTARDEAVAAQAAAETAATTATTKAAEAAASAGVGPALEAFTRSQYRIAGRDPAVIIDPDRGLYMRAAGACDFDDLVTHTRNSAASFTDGGGLIQPAASDAPRTDHHIFKDGIFQRAGLRVDIQATNLLLHSEDVAGTGWSKGSVTVASATAPDGTNTASRITGITSATSYFGQNVTAAAGLNTFSIYARADSDNLIAIRASGFGLSGDYVWFDVAAGTVLTQQAGITDAAVQDVGVGWFRCSVTFDASSDQTGTVYVYLVAADGSNSPAAGGDTLFWGAQLEAGHLPTSYIKTAAAQATRAADNLSISAANMPATPNGFTIIVEGEIDWFDDDAAGHGYWWESVPGGVVTNWGRLLRYSSFVDRVDFTVNTSGGTSAITSPGIGTGVRRPFKLAGAMSSSHVQIVANGLAGNVKNISTAVPDLSAIDLDILVNMGVSLTRYRIFDTALPEAALITETTL